MPNSFGVYAQRYAGSRTTPARTLGPNGEIGSEFRLNATTDGDQRYPSVAMDANGDLIAVWSGNGAVGATSIRKASSPSVSTRRPTPPARSSPTCSNRHEHEHARHDLQQRDDRHQRHEFRGRLRREPLRPSAARAEPHSVLNPDNWQLTKTGISVARRRVEGGMALPIANDDHRNPVTGKFEVLVTFDSDPDTKRQPNPHAGPLHAHDFRKRAGLFGNNLDGDYDGVNGGNFVFNFTIDINAHDGTPSDDPIGDATTIANAHTFPESARAIATALNGKHIAVWTAYDTNLGNDRVYFKVFDADGTAITDRLEVASATDTYYDHNGRLTTFAGDDQRYATIACDGDGDFVITWTNVHNGNSDVFVRRFNAQRRGPTARPFRVNTYTANDQKWSNVAMDAQGDFIVTWSSYGQEDNNQLGKGFGVYARRYNAAGQALAPEFQVNTTTAGNQQNSSVAMANNGQFIIVWQTDQIQGQYRHLRPSFQRRRHAESRLRNLSHRRQSPSTTTQAGNQQYPDVAMNADGSSVVVAWQSSAQDGNGWGIYQWASIS